MCGRDYTTYTDEELEMRYYNKREWRWPIEIPKDFKIQAKYNICPTQKIQVLLVQEGKMTFQEMRWGLVPSWAKTVKDADKYSMINAKAEEITEKQSYKIAFQKRRCIVPVSGFYEWQRMGDKKKPFAIQLVDKTIMSLAGIWEHWTSQETGEVVDSYAIITTASNTFMEKIHTRMPVILDQKDEEAWLDPENFEPKNLMPFLKPCPSEWLEAFEVSTLVNSPKNDGPEVLRATF